MLSDINESKEETLSIIMTMIRIKQQQQQQQQQQRRRRSNGNDSHQQSTAREQQQQQQPQVRRGSWMRQRFSLGEGNGDGDGGDSMHERRIRHSIAMLRDEFEMSDFDYDDHENDNNNNSNNEDEDDDTFIHNNEQAQAQEQENKDDLHSLVGRIRTIAIVQNTHEKTTLDHHNHNHNNDGENQSSLWRRYEEAQELVVTAVGSHRFRIVSCVNNNDNVNDNACHICTIEELRDAPLPRPPISTLSLPCRLRSRPLEVTRPKKRSQGCSSNEECNSDDNDDDDDDDDDDDNESKADKSPLQTQSIQRHTGIERMAWNLSQQSPTPYFVYRNWMPWSIVDKITTLLHTQEGQSTLPSLGNKNEDALFHRTHQLERTYAGISSGTENKK